MSQLYEELDFQRTPIGDLMLRRRRMISLGDVDIFEVKLGEEFLMTSLFHEAETQLARLGLRELEGDRLEVLVGGLGLGYTAVAALEDSRVASLSVVEFLEPVIRWHRDHLVPCGETLTKDQRCQFVHADFFAGASDPQGFEEGKKYDAILLDIDHTHEHFLNPSNRKLYTTEGLIELASHIKSKGVFGMWADGQPSDEFTERLKIVFKNVQAHVIEFKNPVNGGTSFGAVYTALKS